MVCEPSDRLDVVNDQDVVPFAGAYAPESTLTWMSAKPVVPSLAVPLIVGVAVFTNPLFTGLTITTDRNDVSTCIVIDVVCTFPALSVALAVIVCEPSARLGISNVHELVPFAGAYAPESILTWMSDRPLVASLAVPVT